MAWVLVHENYQIDEFGTVQNIKTGKVLKPFIASNGYKTVSLGRNNAQLVHRLLAKSFIPNPENKATVNHKDGNRLNNSLDNLEWANHKEQIDHKRFDLNKRGGEFAKGVESMRKKPIVAIWPDNKMRVFSGATEAAKVLGLQRETVKNVLRRYSNRTRCGMRFDYV